MLKIYKNLKTVLDLFPTTAIGNNIKKTEHYYCAFD